MHDRRKRKKGKKTRIDAGRVPDNERTRFSFENIQLDHDVFNVEKCDRDFFHALTRSLRDAESMSLSSFLEEDHSRGRHFFDFKETVVPDGFPIEGLEPEQTQAFQFPILDRDSKWRVYGYVLDQIFYIVWLDAAHCIYKTKGQP